MNANENYILKLNPPKELRLLLCKRIYADIKNKTFYAFNEISDELTYIFGDDWKWQFGRLTNEHGSLFGKVTPDIYIYIYYSIVVRSIALDLMLVKHGYVRKDGHCLMYSKEEKSIYEQRAYEIIESEVRRRHPELPESFYVGSSDEYESRKREADDEKIVAILLLVTTMVPLLVFFAIQWYRFRI